MLGMQIVKLKEQLNQEFFVVVALLSKKVENVPIFNHNKVMLDQINGMSITIHAIDSIPIGCGFSDTRFL